jgi:hypothetical protein
MYTERVPHKDSPEVEGYPQYTYGLPILPGDVYNKRSVRVENGELVVNKWTVSERMLARPTDMTWDDIRDHRRSLLEGSDAQLAEDMPENLKQEWRAYRQLLRDLPNVLADVPPNIVYYMFPEHPHNSRPNDKPPAP